MLRNSAVTDRRYRRSGIYEMTSTLPRLGGKTSIDVDAIKLHQPLARIVEEEQLPVTEHPMEHRIILGPFNHQTPPQFHRRRSLHQPGADGADGFETRWDSRTERMPASLAKKSDSTQHIALCDTSR